MKSGTVKQGNQRPRRRKGFVEDQSVFWFRLAVLLVGLLLRYWVRRFRAVGVEKMPKTGGVFLVPNHTSAMDPFLVGYPAAHRMPHGPGKVELFSNPIIGFIMRKMGIFPIRQETADAGAVRAMVQLYRSGEVVIVYPEGGRSPTQELQPFFPDFARLLIRLRACIVPVGLAGAAGMLPMGGRIPRRNTPVAVVFGEPFELSQFYDRELTDDVAREAAEYLRGKVAEFVSQALDLQKQL